MEINSKLLVSSSLGLILLAYLFRKEYTAVVETTHGKYQGIKARSRNGRQFSGFWGIPYAEPPAGNLRFQSPVPARNWTDVRLADKYGIECLQTEIMFQARVLGQEDCLYLNVFSPNDLSKLGELYPVIVFIHGGGFLSGSSKMFGPEYFMDEDVVVVTLNYRLGPLGFLNTGDEVIRGNMGLKDQNLALRWVQENVKYFGGDPNRVTLFGESAGAACVHYHMMSEKSKGLFHAAISSSGTGLASWGFVQDPVGQFKRLGQHLSCDTNSTSEFLECLQKIDPAEIVQINMANRESMVHPLEIYAPSTEQIIDDETFFSGIPLKEYSSKNVTSVPWLMGVNDGEGLMLSARIWLDEVQNKKLLKISEWYKCLPRFIHLEDLSEEKVRKITKFYFNEESDFNPLAKLQNLTNMFSDRFFYVQLGRMIDLYQNRTDIDTPLYLYYYTHRGIFSLFKLIISAPTERILPAEVLGVFKYVKDFITETFFGVLDYNFAAGHGDDLALSFDMGYIFTINSWSSSYEFSVQLVKAIANFAKTKGNSMEFYGKSWPRVQPNLAEFMRLDIPEKSGLTTAAIKDRLNFWKSLELGDII